MQFCIVGTGRCGTTLLQRMMTLHPDLYVFPETHWIPKLYECFGRAPAPTDVLIDIVKRTKHVTGAPTTQICIDQFARMSDNRAELTVREFCDLLGQSFAVEAGKRLWADKTPDYSYFMGTLQSLWPECRFIHVIRDGAAVATSMSRHPGYQVLAAANQVFWCPMSLDYSGRGSIADESDAHLFVQLWYKRMVRTMDEARRLRSGTYLEVRYEHLLQAPEAQLSVIASFLDMETPQHWLQETASLVDRRKLSNSRITNSLIHFGKREKQLLKDLGYLNEAS